VTVEIDDLTQSYCQIWLLYFAVYPVTFYEE